MSWAHTWTGLLFGWVLYFMFLTGSAGYYDSELDAWMEPERAPAIEYSDPLPLMNVAKKHVEENYSNVTTFSIFLPYERSFSPYIRVFLMYQDGEGKTVREDMELLTDGTIAPEGRDTGGGQTLYRMHWTFHYVPRQVGEIIAGLATIFMFAAIVSGIITHKKIFKDFFTLRFSKGQRSWLDAHNVVSVMTLPFQIMITFSGILLIVTTFFLPIFVAQYGYDETTVATVSEEMFGVKPPVERSGVELPLADFSDLLDKFETEFPGEPMVYALITNPGDETSTIKFHGKIDQSIMRDTPHIIFDGTTGTITELLTRDIRNTSSFQDIFEGLHEGLFAGPILRILYFISGLLGAGMIATGLVLWTTKRRQKLRDNEKAQRNLIIIERLNVGVVAGLATAIAAYFYANRLLPIDLTERAEWEVHILFLTWLTLILHSLVRKPSKAWVEQLAIAAIAFAILPVLNAATTSLHLGNTLPMPGRPGDMALAGVDLWFLVIAAGFAYAAHKASKKHHIVTKPNNSRQQETSALEPAE
ncbi:MAG: PepSY-associated TM helix domain-containing protein [Pseudomonadota bacterium]